MTKKTNADFVSTLGIIFKGGLTTKEIELIAIKRYEIPRATFYNLFRKAKKEGYLTSSTNKKHEVIWSLSEKGKLYFEESLKSVIEKGTNTILLFIDRLYDKMYSHSDKWIEYKDFSKLLNKEESSFLKLFAMLGFAINDKYPDLVEFDKIRFNKKVLDKIKKEKTNFLK